MAHSGASCGRGLEREVAQGSKSHQLVLHFMAANYTQLTDKLTLVLWPYLRLTFLFLAGYGLLDGVLLNWLPRFDPPSEFWKFLGPGVLAATLVLWLLWPRLRLLTQNKGQDNLRVLLSMIAVAVMAFGTNCLHDYLRAALGRLEVLDSPASLTASRSLGTYYRFRRRYQTPRSAGIELQTTTSDKGRNLVFHLYVATPLFASPADTGRPAVIWQGLRYSAQVSNHTSETEKKAYYKAFLQHASTQFSQEKFVAPLDYYERIPNTDERAAYARAARSTGLFPPHATYPLLLLQPAQVSVAALKRTSLAQLAGWLCGGTTLFFVVLLIPYLSATSAQRFRTKQR
jgi:hypothetical protein